MSDSVTPWTTACQASLSFTISQSLLKLMSVELMPSSQLILCHPFFSCLQSFLASGSLPVSQLFVSGDQSTGPSASVLPMNIEDWFLLRLIGLISCPKNSQEPSPAPQFQSISSSPFSLLYSPTCTSIKVSWFYYCEKESLERDWGHIWTGFNVHYYLLTLFLGQGTGWLEASDLTSEKARVGKEVTVMGPVWPTGLSAGRMTMRTHWGLSSAVHWCVILNLGRGSASPPAWPHTLADCGQTRRTWQCQGEAVPACQFLRVLNTVFTQPFLSHVFWHSKASVFQLLGQPHSTMLVILFEGSL